MWKGSPSRPLGRSARCSHCVQICTRRSFPLRMVCSVVKRSPGESGLPHWVQERPELTASYTVLGPLPTVLA